MTPCFIATLGLALLGFGAPSWGQAVSALESATGVHFDAERAKMDQTRQAAEARFQEEEVACYQRFAVNDCVMEARARLRAVQTQVRHRRNALNDLERQSRAAQSRANKAR